jgi:hypothetical protein
MGWGVGWASGGKPAVAGQGISQKTCSKEFPAESEAVQKRLVDAEKRLRELKAGRAMGEVGRCPAREVAWVIGLQ